MDYAEEKIKKFAIIAIGENQKAWEPLIKYASVYNISAPKTVKYLKQINVNMDVRKIQRWKKRWIEKWNLPISKPGPSSVILEKEYEDWYDKYGQPSITDLINGWNPGDDITENKWDLSDNYLNKKDKPDYHNNIKYSDVDKATKRPIYSKSQSKLEQITKSAEEAARELEQ